MNIIPEGKKVTIINTYRDGKGNVKVPEEFPIWTTDKPEAVALDPAEDGLSCVVEFVAPATGITVTSMLMSLGLPNSNVFDTVADILPISSVESVVSEPTPI